MLRLSSLLCAIIVAQSLVTAAPIIDSVTHLPTATTTNGTSPLAPRTDTQCNSATYRESPCICNNELGLRLKKLKCGANSFKFKNPNDPKDGTLDFVDNNMGSMPDAQDSEKLECDHIVELQFMKGEIDDDLCKIFTDHPDQYKEFYDFINAGNNLVYAPRLPNKAKGILIAGNNLGDGTTQKAANGVVSYLDQLINNDQTYPGIGYAQTISDELEKIVGKGKGFKSGFQTRYKELLENVKTKAQKQAPGLDPYIATGTAPGTHFVNSGPSDYCSTRRDIHSSGWFQPRRLFDLLFGRSNSKSPASPNPAPSGAVCTKPSSSNSTESSNVKSAGSARPTSPVTSVRPGTKPSTSAKVPTPTTSSNSVKSTKPAVPSKPKTPVAPPKVNTASPVNTQKPTKSSKPTKGKGKSIF